MIWNTSAATNEVQRSDGCSVASVTVAEAHARSAHAASEASVAAFAAVVSAAGVAAAAVATALPATTAASAAASALHELSGYPCLLLHHLLLHHLLLHHLLLHLSHDLSGLRHHHIPSGIQAKATKPTAHWQTVKARVEARHLIHVVVAVAVVSNLDLRVLRHQQLLLRQRRVQLQILQLHIRRATVTAKE